MSKKLKIAILHLGFIYSGGGERLVLEETRGLEKKGHEVTIFTPIVKRKQCFADAINNFKIKTLVPDLPSFIPQCEVLQVLLACALAPLLAFRFRKFEVILAANQPSPWLAFWARKFFGVPYVAYLAQPTRFLYLRRIDRETELVFGGGKKLLRPVTFLLKLADPLARWADKKSIRRANLILANGEHARKGLEQTYQIKVSSCPAGASLTPEPIDFGKRREGYLTLGNHQRIRKPYILLTNRHFHQKKFEYAIAALPAVLKKFPEVSLVITGKEMDYTQDLKKLVARLSLEEKVLFLGLVGEENLKNLYAQAAVYVYTAPEEDFGMGMVEAMGAGTSVVAWNNAGPTGIVVDGVTGFLAKPFEISDLADRIVRILSNQKLAERMSKASRERVKNVFSWERHLNCLEEGLGFASGCLVS